MAVTQSSDVTNTILAKLIESLLISYPYDDLTALPYFRFASIENEATTTKAFPRYVKDSIGAVATELTSLIPTTLSTTAVDVAVSRIGLAREITNTVIEDSILGRSLYVDRLIKDAAILYGEKLDTDATALFPSVTASVGATTVALTIAAMVAAFGSQRANKARGPQVIHMHDLQVKQLQTAQVAATATPWAVFFAPNADSSQFAGYFMGAPVWSSSKNPTANAAVDRVGCIWSQGQSMPDSCAFAYVLKRSPSSLQQTDVLQDANIWATYMRYGVGLVANNFATKIISANS